MHKVKNYDLFSTHAWYVPGVSGMFALLGFFLLGALLSGIVMAILSIFMSQQDIADYGMIVMYPVQFLPAMMYAASKSRKNALFDPGYSLSSKHFGGMGVGGAVLLTVVFSYSVMIAVDLPNYLNAKFTESVPWLKKLYDMVMETMKQMTGGPLWSSFLVTALMAPFFEEWLCRGMILRGLLAGGKMKPVWAIVISALFFALIHMNPWQALNAFILGLLMGWIYYRTGSLWLTMLIHFVNNGTAVVLSQIDSLKDYEYWIDIFGHTWYYIAFAVALAIILGCIVLVKKIPVEHPWGNIDPVEPQV
ncbi:MAG: CPBP family intramembrane metalloprotease [Bacteroidales bacterium]|nr:CPBP family intramembrane metalloprotease [Bacteroidales bacterium]